MKLVLMTACALVGGTLAAQAPPVKPPSAEQLTWARRLLNAMRTSEALLKGIDDALAEERKNDTNMPPVFYDSVVARFKQRAPEIVDSLAPIFARSLSVDDLKQLVSFYESPVGRRFADAQLVFATESGDVGKRWGARVALDVMKELLDRGIVPGPN